MPGVDSLYRLLRAICEAELPDRGRILIIGAGGGREIEALAVSGRNFLLTGVDPSADMLAVAQLSVATANAETSVKLIKGLTTDLPSGGQYDAATAILVMHFLPDDGSKLTFLQDIRRRLKLGATYIHADVCFASRAQFDAYSKAMHVHTNLVGLAEIADGPARAIAKLAFGGEPSCIVSEERTAQLFAEAGFGLIAPIYRGLWYAGWWLEAI